MTYKMVDCATVLDAQHIKDMVASGVQVFGRYLWPDGKGLKAEEAVQIHNAGAGIYLFYEANPTHVSWFTSEQGARDAEEAVKMAEILGTPRGTAICATTDFDALPEDLPHVYEYYLGFSNIVEATGYLADMYGSDDVLEYLYQQPKRPEGSTQTYAWSGGKLASEADIYQYLNGQTLDGVGVDFDKVNRDPGIWWPNNVAPEQKPQTGVNDVQVPELKQGVAGHVDAVKAVQAVIGVKTDGVFGPLTAQSVKNFQKMHSLTADGVVGPETWSKILA